MIKILKEIDSILNKLEKIVDTIEKVEGKKPMTDEEIDKLFEYKKIYVEE